MDTPEIITLGKKDSPKLSVSSEGDSGTIKLSNLPPLDTSSSAPRKSVNFGPGAEMLMNQSRASRSNSPKSDIDISELDAIKIDEGSTSRAEAEKMASSISLSGLPKGNEGIKLNISEPPSLNTPSLGKATAADNDSEKHGIVLKSLMKFPLILKSVFPHNLRCQMRKY